MSLQTFALVASLLTFCGGIVAWYSGAVQKRYAAQRDFGHLLKSYDQLASNQAAILKELDDRFDEIKHEMDVRFNQAMLESKDLKALMMATMAQVNRSENSTGWMRRPEQQG